MRRWFCVLSLAVIVACLLCVGCNRAPEPAPAAPSAPAAEAKTPAEPAPGGDEVAAMTPLDGSAPQSAEGESGGSDPLADAMDGPLVAEGGEEITLFGPLGPAFLKLIGAGDVAIEGDNEKGTISAKPGGEEMEIAYTASEATPKSMGLEDPKSLERSSGFTIEGVVPEKVVRDYLEGMARAGGESEPKVTVTEQDRRVAVDAAIYLTDGKPTEVATSLTGGDASKYIAVPLGESAIVCMPTDASKKALFIVAGVPDSEQVQVTYLNLREVPTSLEGQMAMMRMAAAMQSNQGGGGPSGQGPRRPRGAGQPKKPD